MKWKSACKQLEKQIKPKDGVYIAVEGNDGIYRIDGVEKTEQELQALQGVVIRVEEDGFGAL